MYMLVLLLLFCDVCVVVTAIISALLLCLESTAGAEVILSYLSIDPCIHFAIVTASYWYDV